MTVKNTEVTYLHSIVTRRDNEETLSKSEGNVFVMLGIAVTLVVVVFVPKTYKQYIQLFLLIYTFLGLVL